MSPEPEIVEESPVVEEVSIHARIAQYWAILMKHRRLILVCVALGVAIGAVLFVLAEPAYLARTIITVKRDASSPLDANWRPERYAIADPEFLPTQARLITSREIAERVVRRLNLLENADLNPKRSGMFQPGKEGTSGKAAVPLAQQEVIGLAYNVLGNLDVQQIKGTGLLEISYSASSPKLAANVANAIADEYIKWTLEAKSEMVGNASEFFTAQIEQLKKELEEREQQLLAYGREKDIISVEPGSNITLQKLESLNQDYASAVGDRVAKEARYREIQNSRPETIVDVSSLQAEQARLERDYAERLNLFKPEWPAMQQLKTQIDKGRENLAKVVRENAARIRDGARNDYLTALRREESLKTVLGTQKSEAMALNTNAVEYKSLKTEVDAKRTMLDSLLKRQSETEAMSRLNGERQANVRVVDKALPPGGPYTPSLKRNGVFGLMGGLAVGMGLAFLLSLLDRSIRTPEQVEQLLGLPALGVVPAVGGRPAGGPAVRLFRKKADAAEKEPSTIELLPFHQPRSRIAERYRDLRTSLLLSRAGGVKSLVVTSSFSREGKTTTAVNLAIVLGQLGKRVLLVDADLHKPRIHEILKISNRTGLVSVLVGNVEPARAIVGTEIPQVSVMPSGPSSPNPSGLLSSDAMSRFLSLAQMNFDYVILDAPPVMPVTDSIVLASQTDGAVLCIHGGDTPREQIARVRDKLLRSNVRILGVVINNLDEEESGYGRHYGYDDGYHGEEAAYGERVPLASTARTL